MPRDAEMHELVGAYALDALESDEAALFEQHLEVCPRCRAELRDHRETAAYLAHVGATAPDGVWERIAAQLEDPPAGVEPILPMFATASAQKRRDRSVVTRRATIVAAAAAAFLIAGNSVVLMNQRDRIDKLDPDNISSVLAYADEAAKHTTSRIATLRQPDGTVVADIVITKDGKGYLVRGKFSELDHDHTYQLWGQVGDGEMVSLGLLGRNPIARVFSAELPLDVLAVTVEPSGGTSAPTSPPFVAAEVQRA